MTKNKFKVLIPIEREGKTYWVRSGIAFTNKDDSINVLLDVIPRDGKIQLRDFDEPDRRDTTVPGGPSATHARVRPAAPTDQPPF